MASSPRKLGLIAGQGRLPLLIADGMRAGGAEVHCVGLRDQYEPALREHCDALTPAGILQIGRWIRVLRRAGVREAVMVGAVGKTRMHDPLRLFRQLPDWRAAVIWYRRLRHDRRTPAILAAVAEELARRGITLIDSTTHIPDHLAAPGVMGDVEPTAAQRADVEFGWPMLRSMVELGIGQSMAVRDRDVIAVEAIEGTSAMIERAGALCRARGWTLLKTASDDHDMRADVPTIGIETIDRLADAGAGAVALGAGRVILVDRPAVLAHADGRGIAVIGVQPVARDMTDAPGQPDHPAEPGFVSRAGHKLAHALDAFGLDVTGLDAADFGCNVGGFTDCLLRRGAARVWALDTGYGTLAWTLRQDDRVVVRERTNALHAEPPDGGVDLVVVDLGWTPQRRAVPAALAWLRPGGRIVSLLKPHYERAAETPGAKAPRGGLPEDEAEAVIGRVLDAMPDLGVNVLGRVRSPIVGAKSSRSGAGNVEELVLLERR